MECLLTSQIQFSDILRLVIAGIIATGIAVVAAAIFGASHLSIVNVAGIVNGACWIVGYQFLSKSRGWISLRARFSPVGGGALLKSGAIAVALILLLSAATQSLVWLGTKTDNTSRDPFVTADHVQWSSSLVLLLLIGPLAEELMFRGLLLDWMRQKMTRWPAITLTSLLFAFLHKNGFGNGVPDWLGYADIFSIGIATSLLALRYKSLRPPFILHTTNNCVVTLLIALS